MQFLKYMYSEAKVKPLNTSRNYFVFFLMKEVNDILDIKTVANSP